MLVAVDRLGNGTRRICVVCCYRRAERECHHRNQSDYEGVQCDRSFVGVNVDDTLW